MKHESHTKEHQEKCTEASRTLVQALSYTLEAGQYSWTAVSRPTIEKAMERVKLAEEYLEEALVMVQKREQGPDDPVSTPGIWPVSSS